MIETEKTIAIYTADYVRWSDHIMEDSVDKRGLLVIGDTVAMTVNPPLRMPDPPIPAIALPIMNITELVATPHIRDPSSKIDKKTRKVI
jgi:hypothetical protein